MNFWGLAGVADPSCGGPCVLMAAKSRRRGDPKIATHWWVHARRDVSRAFPQISSLPPVYLCGGIYACMYVYSGLQRFLGCELDA
eukprot:COSAG01_NODE_1553_length_9931_cov_3.092657_8_plen_85_part_00